MFQENFERYRKCRKTFFVTISCTIKLVKCDFFTHLDEIGGNDDKLTNFDIIGSDKPGKIGVEKERNFI